MDKWVPWITGVCVYAENFQLLRVLYGPTKTSPFNTCKFSETHRFNIKHTLNFFLLGIASHLLASWRSWGLCFFFLLHVQGQVGKAENQHSAISTGCDSCRGAEHRRESLQANPAHWLLWVSLPVQARGPGDNPLPLHAVICYLPSMAKYWSQYFWERCRKLKYHLERHVRIACWDCTSLHCHRPRFCTFSDFVPNGNKKQCQFLGVKCCH